MVVSISEHGWDVCLCSHFKCCCIFFLSGIEKQDWFYVSSLHFDILKHSTKAGVGTFKMSSWTPNWGESSVLLVYLLYCADFFFPSKNLYFYGQGSWPLSSSGWTGFGERKKLSYFLQNKNSSIHLKQIPVSHPPMPLNFFSPFACGFLFELCLFD